MAQAHPSRGPAGTAAKLNRGSALERPQIGLPLMRLRHLCLIGAVLAPLSVAHASVPLDERCLITMAAMASRPQYAQIGNPGVIFFASRLTEEQPNYDFAARLKVLATRMGPKDLSAEAQRCAPMVIKTLQALQAAQQTLPRGPAAKAAPGAGVAPPAPPVAPKH